LTKAAFESFSAFGTVGLSLGITPDLTDISKFALIFTMYLGRVGVLTFALSLLSVAHRNYNSFRYREDKIMVG
jgi:trk system potassium uptake protein